MTEVRKVCPTCEGVGYLYDEETFTRAPCNCKIAEYMVKHLGNEIARSPTIFKSPFYELPIQTGEEPTRDRTRENLFITSTWSDLLPHLKLCLWPKGIFFNFRVVTDEKIKTVFVGAESYAQRAKGRRDEIVTYNTLGDLIGPDHPFVIIRLGHLGHKNVAASGAVKEALMLRATALKPTWLIEDPDHVFGPEDFAWSEDLMDYVDRNFERVVIKRSSRAHLVEEATTGVEDISPTVLVETPKAVRQRQMAQPKEEPAVGDFDLPGEDAPPKFKKGKQPWKKTGGSGPV